MHIDARQNRRPADPVSCARVMNETVLSAHSVLREPRRFLAEAGADLRRSPAAAWRLFRSNVIARYRRSALGAFWLLLPTVATTAVWVYLQSRRVVEIAPVEVPYPVYVLTGTIFWQVFVEAMNAPLQQLTSGRQLVTRSRVPQEALILAGLFEVLLNAVVRLIVLVAVLLGFGIAFRTTMLAVPLGIAALALFGLTLGLILAPIGMLYDDVSRAITLVTGFWFFLTPILYRAPERGLLRFNPVTPLLDTTRAWMTVGWRVSSGFALVLGFTLVMLLLAWLFARLARPHVVERLG
jgi:lipopolysaccharide transport system permease protein